MDSRREFVSYTHPSQFQDKQHRKQVKSYVSARAYWVERRTRIRVDTVPQTRSRKKLINEGAGDPDVERANHLALRFISRELIFSNHISEPDASSADCPKKHGPNSRSRGSDSTRESQFECPSQHTRMLQQNELDSKVPKSEKTVAAVPASASSEFVSCKDGAKCRYCPKVPMLLLPKPQATTLNGLPHALRRSRGFPAASEFCECGSNRSDGLHHEC